MGASNIVSEFNKCTQLQYNGQLQIESKKNIKWIFYYRLGRVVWASGGHHPFRRWRRMMKSCPGINSCPNLDIEEIPIDSQKLSVEYWDYNVLEALHTLSFISREQINFITEKSISELLFDIAQEANFHSVSCERNQDVILETPMSFTSADMLLKQMEDSWNHWSEAGLANFSPNLTPMLRRTEQLQQQVSSNAYQNFVRLMNGKYTLRDLGLIMKQNPLAVTRSLLPYVLKGIIELQETDDKPLQFNCTEKTCTPGRSSAKTPLVACIDDSPQVCQMVKKILTKNGLRALSVEDSVQALPKLIEHKPDLIFLDLVMPVVSGYEICSQLRRISMFAETPVIILTGSDSLADKVRRLRAKAGGANECITKPVNENQIMEMVHKYLQSAHIPC